MDFSPLSHTYMLSCFFLTHTQISLLSKHIYLSVSVTQYYFLLLWLSYTHLVPTLVTTHSHYRQYHTPQTTQHRTPQTTKYHKMQNHILHTTHHIPPHKNCFLTSMRVFTHTTHHLLKFIFLNKRLFTHTEVV
jgi:hypothetical protein